MLGGEDARRALGDTVWINPLRGEGSSPFGLLDMDGSPPKPSKHGEISGVCGRVEAPPICCPDGCGQESIGPRLSDFAVVFLLPHVRNHVRGVLPIIRGRFYANGATDLRGLSYGRRPG